MEQRMVRASAAPQRAAKHERRSTGARILNLDAARRRLVGGQFVPPRGSSPAGADPSARTDSSHPETLQVTPEARELLRLNVNRYSTELIARARRLSTSGEIEGQHVELAEAYRMVEESAVPAQPRHRLLAVECLQLTGAAVCGALATSPALLEPFGLLPLLLAVAGTAVLFITREVLERH
jgi:hypothetical protein